MALIDISPDVLEYKPPFTTQSTEYATITNNSAQPVVFKVKTTAPKFYCVRPNAALVQPGESVQVQVILLGLGKEPASDFKCRDKFLVITLPAPYDLGDRQVADVWHELETEFKHQAVSKKIKVKYVSGGTSADAAGASAASAGAAGGYNEETARGYDGSFAGVDGVPKTAESQDSELLEKPKVDSNVDVDGGEAAVGTKQVDGRSSSSEGSLNSTALVLVALIALVLGWLYY
ncbi:hypothetical protein ZYGR_0E01840 [Zygosaccharomyces rouxii]|uniref:ZYRO0B04092p n=2 Tax=Zygosaccharomyces rouxii TaxID=4956 RepID=C5DQY9_ZYGRC|nr:uncharacterized protein ZYRO0B04092g [Zygosaccharomyces rouxii]KAH9200251.1 PapD-like protein [Zygosaccharomyces rouxii]GAV47168.1 hypothetical protein ZYGR_0E01840 [Zygosaccharomyces rouxii]CAR26200.1 ZYRO0B04092p [Zygosaccharomyces rouxii]